MEKTGEDTYLYATRYFPFAGTLRVVKTAIAEMNAGGAGGGWMTGQVMVELVGVPEGFFEKHSQSWGIWMRGNTLYFDQNAGRWVGEQEFSRVFSIRAREFCQVPGWGSFVSILSGILLVLLFLLAVLLVFRTRKAMRAGIARQEKSMADVEKSLQLAERRLKEAEETNRLLREVLSVLGSSWGLK